MKKYRVKREMPFLKVGKVLETTSYGELCIESCLTTGTINESILIGCLTLDKMCREGWLEEVKEETLEEKLESIFNKHDHQYSSSKAWRKAIKSNIKYLFKEWAIRISKKNSTTYRGRICLLDDLIKAFEEAE